MVLMLMDSKKVSRLAEEMLDTMMGMMMVWRLE